MAVPLYVLKYYVHTYKKFSIFTAILAITTLVLYRYLIFTLLVWSFVLGSVVAYFILSRDFLLPSILPYLNYNTVRKSYTEGDDEFTLMRAVCTVCGQKRCPRHRQELNILAFQPWTGLEVRESVDTACDEFLTIVLNEFVYTWYRNLSTDEEFVDELRTSIRFIFSVLLRRAKKLDLPKLVTEKFIKAGVQHLHAHLQAREHASSDADVQEAMMHYLGPHLHCALQSRRTEQEYLRRLVEKLFPYILRPQALQSKAMCALLREIIAASVLMPAMDAVANPDMVNNMLLILLDSTPSPPPPEVPSPMVPFLAHFVNQKYRSLSDPEIPPKVCKSTLRFVLGDVMDPEKPKMLYPYMQFLKGEAAINVLQFALSCEDFNKKILDPELSQQDLEKLHGDLRDLYRNYLASTAPDRIKFDESIVSEIHDVVEGDPDDVIKLRRSTPMFRAYEHVYNLLNHTFLPLFHQSEEYYTMICGERLASQVNRANAAPPRNRWNKDASIGSKLSRVFKQADSKSVSSLDLMDIENNEDADTVTVASASSLDDDLANDHHSGDIDLDPMTPHDLSTWRVTIPRLGARPDPENNKKTIFVFIVDVRRVDVPDEGKTMWTVARRYGEFYVLEQKLKEFHGELDDCVLPEKKMFGTNKQDFIDGKRDAFEQYLQKLLTKPFLKGSQLLYNFLTSEKAFDFGFDINIGRALKSVPRKLVKEKGQHLESFLVSLEKTIEAQKPVPSKRERRDSGASQLSTSSLKLCQSIFENNANGLERRELSEADLQTDRRHLDGVYDTLVYIARFAYGVPDWLHHTLYTTRMFVKQTLEDYLDWFINHKVTKVTQEHRLVSLINLLRDVLFFDNDPPRTDHQKQQRYEDTLNGCLEFLPRPLVYAMGDENHERGTKLILELLQQPKLNKQLTYVFLDIFISEMFPELTERPSQS